MARVSTKKTVSKKAIPKIICDWCGSDRVERMEEVVRETANCIDCGSVFRLPGGIVNSLNVSGDLISFDDGKVFAEAVIRQRNVFLGNGDVLDRALSGEKAVVYGEINNGVAETLVNNGWDAVLTHDLMDVRGENDIVIAPNFIQTPNPHEDILALMRLLRGGGYLVIVMEDPSKDAVSHGELGNFMIPAGSFEEYSGVVGRTRIIPMNSGEYSVWIK